MRFAFLTEAAKRLTSARDSCALLLIGVANLAVTSSVIVPRTYAQDATPGATSATRVGLLHDPNFFPLAVWLQNPANAPRYKAAGINLYVGLWRGPTDQQLALLKEHGMYVICSQNTVGLSHKDDPTILGWMHGDEPDNAQRIRGQKGYGPPIEPSKIVADYKQIKERDPSRPVLLNLGQGVAWDQYIGRGVRRNHPEDYAQYAQGCDIASFDIYPACHEHLDVAGKLWFVADGVSRLRKWAGDERTVWNCIECTHISNPKAKATPRQVKAEVWMSIVRGSRGIIYFCHQFQPTSIEAGLLADAEMMAAVTATNKQIQELAAVLNSPTIADGWKIESSNADVPVEAEVPVEAIVKRHAGETYVFAVCLRGQPTSAAFKFEEAALGQQAIVLGEDRALNINDSQFSDSFQPWDVHLYKIVNTRE
jgi:hypothetical protein